MRNITDKRCRYQNTFYVPTSLNIVPFMRLCKILRAGQATDDSVAHAHCMLDTEGNKYSEYVILIAFLLQWLHERASWLRYTYIPVISLTSVALPANIIRLLSNEIFFIEDSFTPQPPAWTTRVSPIWVITHDLSGMGGSTSSKDNASIALSIMATQTPE